MHPSTATTVPVSRYVVEAPVISYITEEVWRQGHDVTDRDGIQRVGWMSEAWSLALGASEQRPSVSDALSLGRLVERLKNKKVPRTCYVRVGMRPCAPPREVPRLMELLWEQRDVLTPVEFYKGFEEIHPFVDGNGRTGKILLNWLNGSLLNPIFPPADLFGHPIRNP